MRLPALAALALLMAVLPLRLPAQEVTVGIRDMPPFAITDPSGVHTGLAVDLFRLTAEAAGLTPNFVPVAPGEDPAAALASLDILLPVEAEPALEARLDLTHPVYTATLGYAQAEQTRILKVLTGFLTLEFLRVVASVAGLLLVVGAIIWLIERRKNAEMFARKPLRGLGDGFWWAGVTLTTIGYGDKAPTSFWGRAVAMIWMLAGLAVSASLTAAVVSLSGGEGTAELDLPEALRDRSVVVIEDSLAARFLQGRGLEAVAAPDAATALQRVADEDAQIAVGAAPVLQWANSRIGTGLTVRTTRWDPVLIAIALPDGSEALREGLNRALLGVLASEAGQETVRRYLPDG